LNDEISPETTIEDRSPLASEFAAADTLDETAEVLLRALEGESESGLLPHRYILETYKGLSRQLRDDVDQSALSLLDGLAGRAEWNIDAAVELLLLTRSLFVSREAAHAALVFIARILATPHDYAPEIAVAAGQAAIALGYHGAPDLWHRLYEMAGDHAVPTVVGGLAKTDWKALLDWLDLRSFDAWIERTVINLLPAFLVTQGTERVHGLANSVWPSTSESGRKEIRSFMKRKGLEFEPVESAVEPTQADWSQVIRRLMSGEVALQVEEAGAVELYVRKLFVDRSPDAPSEFRHALNVGLIRLRDASRASERSLDTMLDLISAFTPERGAAEIVDCLEKRGTALGGAAILKALAAVSLYYKEPPATGLHDRAYKRYVQALRKLTAHPEVGPIALGALLALNAIDFKDGQFASMVARDEGRQRQIVDFAVGGGWSAELLSWLLGASVRASSREQPAVFDSFIAHLRRHAGNTLRIFWQSIEIPPDTRIVVPRDLSKPYAILFERVVLPELHRMYQNVTED
jgi:hypothetical protein